MFLGQGSCVGHGEYSTSSPPNCCSGLYPWYYDAKTGIPNAPNTYGCWIAACASAGEYAGPNGTNAGKCCSGLTADSQGKCGTGTGGGGTITCPPGTTLQSDGSCRGTTVCPTGQMLVGTSCVPAGSGVTPCAGTIVCSIPDMYLYIGGGVLLLMLMMGMKKKKAVGA